MKIQHKFDFGLRISDCGIGRPCKGDRKGTPLPASRSAPCPLPLASCSLYLHIPFCQRKCPYCDFNTFAGQESRYDAFTSALATDIARDGLDRGCPHAPTIFLGGGTPTVLTPDHLEQIFSAIDKGFQLAPAAEISSEANPGTVDQSRFETLRHLGVNRLSMGVQSFDADELRFLGRIHTGREAIQAFRLARKVGFDNINLDFMFGLPEQKLQTWTHTLEQAIDLSPEHISLYSLTVEPDTPLASWVARGQISEPDPDLAADLYDIACERLSDVGYHQYEISNWARGPIGEDGLPGYACQHNLVYWRNGSYLGFGPGAHSSYAGRRWSILRTVGDYIQAVAANASLLDYQEDIPKALEMGETMMLGLRLVEVGVERSVFRQRFGVDVTQIYPEELERLQVAGLLEVTPERVRLTPQAKLLGNEVFAAFLPET